jgi:hypothetical protein
MGRRRYEYAFEVERGDETVEYLAVYTVSPGEPARGPSYSSGGEPGCAPEVDELDVYYVHTEPCRGCKGTGVVQWEHLDGVKTPARCPACLGRKTVTLRDPRPELESVVDEGELLLYAGETEEADESAAVDRQVDEDRDERRLGR